MSRPHKISASVISVLAASTLLLAGCSQNNEAGDPGASGAASDSANPSGSPDSSSSTRPGADGSTLRYVFTVIGGIGSPPPQNGEAPKIPQEQIDEAANQLKARFAALGKEDAVTVEGDKVIVETSGLADDLMYLASLAPLSVQVRQVQAIITGEGKFTPEPGPDAIKLVTTDSLSQGWIDDVSNRNCIDPLKMSIAVGGAPADAYVAYCVPTEFVRSGGENENTEVIGDVHKVIYGPALMSNTDIESTAVSETDGSPSMDFTANSVAKSKIEAAAARIAGLPKCEVAQSAPSLEQVQRGCGEVSIIVDGIALTLGGVDKTIVDGVAKTPFSFVGWEPRLVSEAAPIFSLEPLSYSFQRVE